MILVTPAGLSKVTQGGVANWRITSVRPIKPTDANDYSANSALPQPDFGDWAL